LEFCTIPDGLAGRARPAEFSVDRKFCDMNWNSY
jgi:hypothetical protein